jgi:hypothetical protein
MWSFWWGKWRMGRFSPSTSLLSYHSSNSAFSRLSFGVGTVEPFFTYVLSRVGVNYKMGFGLDDWIYCTLYIHNSGLQVITALSLIYAL